MIKGLFALLMAGTLMVPHITPALGNESTVGLGAAWSTPPGFSSWESVPLPPVPYLDTMPWLSSGAIFRGPKVDLLWEHKLERFGPFLVQPEIPLGRFSSSSQSSTPALSTE
jgi:hypothetical protein